MGVLKIFTTNGITKHIQNHEEQERISNSLSREPILNQNKDKKKHRNN